MIQFAYLNMMSLTVQVHKLREIQGDFKCEKALEPLEVTLRYGLLTACSHSRAAE